VEKRRRGTVCFWIGIRGVHLELDEPLSRLERGMDGSSVHEELHKGDDPRQRRPDGATLGRWLDMGSGKRGTFHPSHCRSCGSRTAAEPA
jgi:hypothetical protein